MHLKYYVLTFAMCFFVWAILVDNMVVPSNDAMSIAPGTYSRYRVKKWSQDGKLNLLKDEILVYAYVKGREQIYYIEYSRGFESTLKNLPEGTPVQMRYVSRFPKVWKRHLYDLRANGRSVVSYSSYYLKEKQTEIWKITGIIGGIYLVLVVLGLLNRPRRK